MWKQGIDLAKKVYACTASFPVAERYGLTSPMRRAAVSIPSNIAEGYARTGTGEYLRFLSISLGSVAELETQVILSTEFSFLDQRQSEERLSHLDLIGKMLRGLQRSLEPYRVPDCGSGEPVNPMFLTDPPIEAEEADESESSLPVTSSPGRSPKSEVRSPKRRKTTQTKE